MTTAVIDRPRVLRSATDYNAAVEIRALRDLLGIPADLLLEAAEEPRAGRTDQVTSLSVHGRQAAVRTSVYGAYKVRGKQRVAKGNPQGMAASTKTVHSMKKGAKATRKK